MIIKKKKKKRGALLTIAFTMMALTVFTLSIKILQSTQQSNERVSELASMDRLYDTYSSIEQGLLEIFKLNSGVRASLNASNTTVSIEESIPNEKAASFKNSVSEFENFVESKFPGIVNMDLSQFKTYLPLIINPYNITYTHADGYGFDRIQIIPAEVNFGYYDVHIYSPSENITYINWEDSTSGNMLFNVTADDYMMNHFAEHDYVDITKTVNVHVMLVSGKEIKIKVDPNSNGKLEIENKADNQTIVRTTIGFNETNDWSDITSSQNIITVNLPEMGISKQGTIKIS